MDEKNMYNDSSVVTTERIASEALCELLKKHGFNEKCRAFWKPAESGTRVLMTCDGGSISVCDNTELAYQYDNALAAPTHQTVHDWLADKWGIFIKIDCIPAANKRGYAFIGVIKDMGNKCMPFETAIDEFDYESSSDAFETLAKYTLEEIL